MTPLFARSPLAPSASPTSAEIEPVTGYVPPAATYDKMRQMQGASAAPMNRDVEDYVASAPYRAAWGAWYRTWLEFFDKYAGPDSSSLAKLGAAIYSEEVAKRAESFRLQLMAFYETYPKQKAALGGLVPAAHGVPPLLGGLPESSKSGISSFALPWWVYGIGILGLGAFAYSAYVQVRGIQAKRRAIETDVLPKLIGPDLAKAASARDPARGRARRSVRRKH